MSKADSKHDNSIGFHGSMNLSGLIFCFRTSPFLILDIIPEIFGSRGRLNPVKTMLNRGRYKV